MHKDKIVTQPVRYFFRRLERRAAELELARQAAKDAIKEVEFEEVEMFFRDIMTQNIFIHTVGINGKAESTILSKAIFSMNRVVRVFYSTSFDDVNSGFIRVRPEPVDQTIIVERVHGFRGKPELMYQNPSQHHIIRYMVNYLLKRIDWEKTKLHNLDMYKRMLEQVEKEQEQAIMDKEMALAEMVKEQARTETRKSIMNRVKTLGENNSLGGVTRN